MKLIDHMNKEVIFEIKFKDHNLSLRDAEMLNDLIQELVSNHDQDLFEKLDFVIRDI